MRQDEAQPCLQTKGKTSPSQLPSPPTALPTLSQLTSADQTPVILSLPRCYCRAPSPPLPFPSCLLLGTSCSLFLAAACASLPERLQPTSPPCDIRMGSECLFINSSPFSSLPSFGEGNCCVWRSHAARAQQVGCSSISSCEGLKASPNNFCIWGCCCCDSTHPHGDRKPPQNGCFLGSHSDRALCNKASRQRGSQLHLPMNSSQGKSLLTLVPRPVLSGCPQPSGLGIITNSKMISLPGFWFSSLCSQCEPSCTGTSVLSHVPLYCHQGFLCYLHLTPAFPGGQ